MNLWLKMWVEPWADTDVLRRHKVKCSDERWDNDEHSCLCRSLSRRCGVSTELRRNLYHPTTSLKKRKKENILQSKQVISAGNSQIFKNWDYVKKFSFLPVIWKRQSDKWGLIFKLLIINIKNLILIHNDSASTIWKTSWKWIKGRYQEEDYQVDDEDVMVAIKGKGAEVEVSVHQFMPPANMWT